VLLRHVNSNNISSWCCCQQNAAQKRRARQTGRRKKYWVRLWINSRALYAMNYSLKWLTVDTDDAVIYRVTTSSPNSYTPLVQGGVLPLADRQRLESFLRRARRSAVLQWRPADICSPSWGCWRYPFPQSKILLPPSPPHPFTWTNQSSISFKI